MFDEFVPFKIYDLEEYHLNMRIKEIINNYYVKLDRIINEEKYQISLVGDYLLAIVEAFSLFRDKNKWIENAYKLLLKVKKNLNSDGMKCLGFFGSGLCDVGFAINSLVHETGTFIKYVNSFNELSYQQIDNFCKLIDIRDMRSSYYDVINGLGGMLAFLTECPDTTKRNIIMQTVINKIDEIAMGNHMYADTYVTNWFIPQKNIYRKEVRDLFKQGLVDFSLSHGIMGPFYSLAKVYASGLKEKNIIDLISHFIELYHKWRLRVGNIYYWPGQLSIEDFYSFKKDNYSSRQSWCYGALGISGALYAISNYINNKQLKEFAIKNLVCISMEPIEDYILESPIICHGYAGVLAVLLRVRRKEGLSILDKCINELTNAILMQYNSRSKYGFRDIHYINNGKIYVDDNSFLEGSTGIVLVLLGLCKEITYVNKHLLIY